MHHSKQHEETCAPCAKQPNAAAHTKHDYVCSQKQSRSLCPPVEEPQRSELIMQSETANVVFMIAGPGQGGDRLLMLFAKVTSMLQQMSQPLFQAAAHGKHGKISRSANQQLFINSLGSGLAWRPWTCNKAHHVLDVSQTAICDPPWAFHGLNRAFASCTIVQKLKQ